MILKISRGYYVSIRCFLNEPGSTIPFFGVYDTVVMSVRWDEFVSPSLGIFTFFHWFLVYSLLLFT